jgi:predicted lipoprotein with Yx(FWY)xxD motif
MQVTYAGQPLYFFAGDEQPGDTNGQAVGDVWFVVTPDGTPIEG